MIEDKTEETTYQRLAEAVLQNRLLSQRLDMMTRMCSSYADARVELCQQLAQFDLVITSNNEIIRKPSK